MYAKATDITSAVADEDDLIEPWIPLEKLSGEN
jgi:hypothetical protein